MSMYEENVDLHKRLLEKGIILLREEDYNYFSNKLITMKEAKE